MNRLQKLLRQKKSAGEKVLSIFLTAGYPELASTGELVTAVANAGADFVELGIPFSDPMADGPTIQASSQKALENGMTLPRLLRQVESIRAKTEIPILLMGYLNPLISYGMKAFLRDAETSGVDGLIIPDLIPEEYEHFRQNFAQSSMGLNFLISPNSTAERVAIVDGLSHAFIYCVAVTGVTGAREGVANTTIEFLKGLRQRVSKPYLVGFGISSAADAAVVARYCSGVIVGSAVTKIIAAETNGKARLDKVGEFVTELRKALRGV